MTLPEVWDALDKNAAKRVTAQRLADERRFAEAKVVEQAIFWSGSRESESQFPQIHAEDCDALAAAVEAFHKAEAAEELHHAGLMDGAA